MSHSIINTNGAAIRVGDSGSGEPALVFLHYWGGSAATDRRYDLMTCPRFFGE